MALLNSTVDLTVFSTKWATSKIKVLWKILEQIKAQDWDPNKISWSHVPFACGNLFLKSSRILESILKYLKMKPFEKIALSAQVALAHTSTQMAIHIKSDKVLCQNAWLNNTETLLFSQPIHLEESSKLSFNLHLVYWCILTSAIPFLMVSSISTDSLSTVNCCTNFWAGRDKFLILPHLRPVCE